MSNFLIPLTKRGKSEACFDNVLWNRESTYVMDNHRLALWCWFQKMEKNQRYNLLHIDAHPDLSESGVAHFNHDLWTMSLEDYRNTLQEDINLPLFRWDNYIEIFLKHYPTQVGHTVSATHHLGSNKTLNQDVRVYDLLKYVKEIFYEKRYENSLPWIVNLDLDYFYSAAPDKTLLFSEGFLKELALAFVEGKSRGMIKILTVSLSPECCGSWEKAEKLLKYFLNSSEAPELI